MCSKELERNRLAGILQSQRPARCVVLRVATLLLVLVSGLVSAEDIQISHLKTRGTSCKSADIHFLKSGNDFAFILDAFQLDLPAGVAKSPLAAVRTCYIQMDLTIPSGYCLKGVSHSGSGGVLKSYYSWGYAYANFYVSGLVDSDLKLFHWNDEIRPEDADSNFTMELTKSRSSGCIKGTVRYYLNLVAVAVRASRQNNSMILQLDSIDGSFNVVPR